MSTECQECFDYAIYKGNEIALCVDHLTEKFRSLDLDAESDTCNLCHDEDAWFRFPTVAMCKNCMFKFLNEGEDSISTKYNVKFLVEEADHGGYCSGNECDYDSYKENDVLEVKGLQKPKIGDSFTEKLEGPGQSGYCYLSGEARGAKLGPHSRRKTIKKILGKA